MSKSVLAYYDSISGMIPCYAVACAGNDIVLRVNAPRGPYKRGEIIAASRTLVIPRDRYHKSRRGPFHYYTTPYSWSEYALPAYRPD